jgi:hypothetical protein
VNNNDLTRPNDEARQLCVQALEREEPDYQAAQVYAILSVEEALRDLATTIRVALRRIG